MPDRLLLPINRRYGTYRGLARLLLSYAEVHAGDLRSLRNPKFGDVRRLVFVCQGNICRSCFAEAYAQSLGLSSSSCGLAIAGSVPAYGLAIETAARFGIDLSGHRARSAHTFDWAEGDLILAMEPRQMRRLRSVALPLNVQQSLLGLWAAPSRPHIHDPHALSSEYFRTCFQVIRNAVDRLSNAIAYRTRE
jgi:protein-tyrosine phosphatase